MCEGAKKVQKVRKEVKLAKAPARQVARLFRWHSMVCDRVDVKQKPVNLATRRILRMPCCTSIPVFDFG